MGRRQPGVPETHMLGAKTTNKQRRDFANMVLRVVNPLPSPPPSPAMSPMLPFDPDLLKQHQYHLLIVLESINQLIQKPEVPNNLCLTRRQSPGRHKMSKRRVMLIQLQPTMTSSKSGRLVDQPVNRTCSCLTPAKR